MQKILILFLILSSLVFGDSKEIVKEKLIYRSTQKI